jgi:methionyl-tRNA formyltransferase
MVMAQTLDTGDILLQERLKIERGDTAGDLSIKLSEVGVRLLVSTLDGLDRGEIIPMPQDHAKATYAPLLRKEDGLIDWGTGPEEIFNKIRGFDPWPGAYTFYKGRRWGVWKAEVLEKRDLSHSTGEIIRVQPDGIVVAAGDGSLKMTEIQAEGKRRMPVAEYLRGHKVEKGVILDRGEGGKVDTA